MDYPRLFQPIQIGNLSLPNRIMMGAMHTNFETQHDASERLAAFYRARSEVGLIVTGGVSPDEAGRLYPGADALLSPKDLAQHQPITEAVHQAGGRIALQILHAGRYAKGANRVSVSDEPSRINPGPVQALDETAIQAVIAAHGRCAALAEQAGYDAIEVMASEGYLLATFLSPATNQRHDDWGGDIVHRARLLVAVLQSIKANCALPVIFRISAADLLPKGNHLADIQRAIDILEANGADAINLGIGWHESPVPTISSQVPRGAFSDLAAKLRSKTPLILSNRIAMPDDADRILATTNADMVSLARPLLADPGWVSKAKHDAPSINTCIACNQACLDRAFEGKAIGCVVNPSLNRVAIHSAKQRRIAVVGAGAAGMSAALQAAKMGHHVTLYESANQIGGQLIYAAMVPGKEDYQSLIRYFHHSLSKYGVAIKLSHIFDRGNDYDKVIWATGVHPRWPIQAQSNVLDYQQAFTIPREKLGQRIIVIGGGPIAVDFCHYLYGPSNYHAQWGIKETLITPPSAKQTDTEVILLQRGQTSPHKKLGKTTGWAHWAALEQHGLRHYQGCEYLDISPNRVLLKHGNDRMTFTADSVVCCTGQEANHTPEHSIRIGGCLDASGIDLERAIKEGYEAALSIG